MSHNNKTNGVWFEHAVCFLFPYLLVLSLIQETNVTLHKWLEEANQIVYYRAMSWTKHSNKKLLWENVCDFFLFFNLHSPLRIPQKMPDWKYFLSEIDAIFSPRITAKSKYYRRWKMVDRLKLLFFPLACCYDHSSELHLSLSTMAKSNSRKIEFYSYLICFCFIWVNYLSLFFFPEKVESETMDRF